MHKYLTLTVLCGLFFMAFPVLANEVREERGKLRITIDAFSDSYALFEKLAVTAERADQGFFKRFEKRGTDDMLEIRCTFDHHTECEFTYANAARTYLTDENGRTGIVIPSAAVSEALYYSMSSPAIVGYGQSRKMYMTSDAKLEIQCTVYDSQPGKPSCMFEIIK